MTDFATETLIGPARVRVLTARRIAVAFERPTYRGRGLQVRAILEIRAGSWTADELEVRSYLTNRKASAAAVEMVTANLWIALAQVPADELAAARCAASAQDTRGRSSLEHMAGYYRREVAVWESRLRQHDGLEALCATGDGAVLDAGLRLLDGGFPGSPDDLVRVSETLALVPAAR